MLATADYCNCLYFWNMLSRLPQAHLYNPAAWLQEPGSGTVLPGRGYGVQGLPGGHRHPQSVLQECEVWEWVAGRTEQTAWTWWAHFPPYTSGLSWQKSTPIVCGGVCMSWYSHSFSILLRFLIICSITVIDWWRTWLGEKHSKSFSNL